MNDLNNKELDRVIELYIKHRKDFKGICTIENFYEQFCHICDTCGRIVCVLELCEECDVKEEKNEFQEFELNKEKILYNL